MRQMVHLRFTSTWPTCLLMVALIGAACNGADPAGPSEGERQVRAPLGRMSNVTQEFCASQGTVCSSWSFSGKAAADHAYA